MTKTATLQDSFAIEDSSKWDWAGTTHLDGASVAGNTLIFNLDATTNTQIYLQSSAWLDFTDSFYLVEVDPHQENGSTWFYVDVQGGGYTGFEYATTTGDLWMMQSASVETGAAVPYDREQHRWLRLREQGGQLFWDTSPDGRIWTNRHTETSAFTSLTAVTPSLWVDGDDGYVRWKNVNLPPPPLFAGYPVLVPQDVNIYQPQIPSPYYDRWHFMIEDRHGNILARDVLASEAKVTRMLSGPCEIEFKIHPRNKTIQAPGGTGPIQFKPWAQWCHAMKMGLDGTEKIYASGLFQPSEVDPESGVMTARFKGFSDYPSGIPWLENWNPIAVDPFEITARIWNHIQTVSGGSGNMGVTVYPTDSGTQMLPGFSFNNEEFVQDFFAIFIRAIDKNDCGDYINKLARDIPFDYWEETTWAGGAAPIVKKIRQAYPFGGVDQADLIFRKGQNVLATVPKQESEVEWFSDITVNGYFPGKVYSHTITNADPDRYRRVMDETDLNINSNERAAAWGHRRLTRRQFPFQFESIIVDPYHPNAPFGSYDVGDFVRIHAPNQWVGDVDTKHKVMSWQWDEKTNKVQLNTMAEGAFNYDPIEFTTP